MIRNLNATDTAKRKEAHTIDEKAKAEASKSTQLSRLNDVRIVRVSRGFGGKDRHSKVCTVRGLRDRRVRLSVPTAIQLYDLQDRLGLSQPSKVVDWLLNIAKQDIDKLPPLPMLPGNFGLDHSSGVPSAHQVSNPSLNEGGFNFSKNIDLQGSNGLTSQNSWTSDTHWRSNTKLHREAAITKKDEWITTSRDGERRKESSECHGESTNVSSSNLSQRGNHPPMLGFLNGMPLGYHWEPSNLSLSQSRNHGFTYQVDDRSNNVDVASLPSAPSLSTGMPQFLVCSPGVAQSYNPSHVTSSMEIDPTNINLAVHAGQMMSTSSQLQLSNSFNSSLYRISQPMKSINLGMTTDNPYHSADNSNSQSHKIRDFPF